MKTRPVFHDIEWHVHDHCVKVLETSKKKPSLFREFMEIEVDGSTKLLMIVGATNQFYDSDNICIAVLNPDRILLRKLHPGIGYNGSKLRRLLQRKCDLALALQINVGHGLRVDPYFEYMSRVTEPPRFNYLHRGD
jgi:hypothetical protein